MDSLAHLPDAALTARLYEIRKEERALLVEFLHCLNELERRRTVLELGFANLFAFCTDHLGLSNGTAFRRTKTAQLMARFPVLAEYLADGRLTTTTLMPLRELLTEDRLVEILGRAAGRNEEQVKELAVALRPQPAPAELFRKLPSAPAVQVFSRLERPVEDHEVARSTVEDPRQLTMAAVAVEAPVVEKPRAPAKLEPIAPDLHVLRVTVTGQFKSDLEAVRQALSHKLPSASIEQLLHECLRVTLDACQKRRRGAGKEPTRKNHGRRDSRYIPAAIRNQVWKRDGGQCTFVGSAGHRCTSKHRLEFHHIDPFGKGGATSVENLTLRCQGHNRHAAEQDYGREHMARVVPPRAGEVTYAARYRVSSSA